jgi:hypothetical protein
MNGELKPPPALKGQLKGFKTGGMRTKNPFYYMTGSIAATQKRRHEKEKPPQKK